MRYPGRHGHGIEPGCGETADRQNCSDLGLTTESDTVAAALVTFMEGNLDEGPVLQLHCPILEAFFDFLLQQTALDLGFGVGERSVRSYTERFDLDDVQSIGRADDIANVALLHRKDYLFELRQCLPSFDVSQIATVGCGSILGVEPRQISKIAPIPGLL